MLYSMTAFAQQKHASDAGTLSWEIKTVNNRYLDAGFRLPEQLKTLEPVLREHIKQHLQRGKVEASLNFVEAADARLPDKINDAKLKQLAGLLSAVADTMPQCLQPDALTVLRWPGVLQEQQANTQPLAEEALALFKTAIIELSETRAREGVELGKMLSARLDKIDGIIEQLRREMPKQLDAQQERMRAKLKELETNCEPARLEQELVFLAQKADTSEEVDRLETHVSEVRRVIAEGGLCGRRLDFLMQELNREANTLSSKSISATLGQFAVELKVLIEQMREQIQNIE